MQAMLSTYFTFLQMSKKDNSLELVRTHVTNCALYMTRSGLDNPFTDRSYFPTFLSES